MLAPSRSDFTFYEIKHACETTAALTSTDTLHHDNNGLLSPVPCALACSDDGSSTGRSWRNDNNSGIYKQHILHVLALYRENFISFIT